MLYGVELLILELLASSLGWSMSVTELVKRSGLTRKMVTASLSTLQRHGKVILKDGRYGVNRPE